MVGTKTEMGKFSHPIDPGWYHIQETEDAASKKSQLEASQKPATDRPTLREIYAKSHGG